MDISSTAMTKYTGVLLWDVETGTSKSQETPAAVMTNLKLKMT